MAGADDVSHGDIYHKLGSLEGKVEALLISIGERRDDINNVFSRLQRVEYRVAWAMGAAVIVSLLAPHVLGAMQPRIHIGAPTHEQR